MMEEDFIQELEFIGFTARIKRLSDSLLYDARKVYETNVMEIEPNWHLVFLLLKKKKRLTVTEIAKDLGFSHPALIKITKQMKRRGYLETNTDKADKRCQILQLSKKGLEMLPQFEQKWSRFKMATTELVGADFLKQLTLLEQRLNEESFFERCQKSLQEDN